MQASKAGSDVTKNKSWPKNGQVMSGAIRRLARLSGEIPPHKGVYVHTSLNICSLVALRTSGKCIH